ncbi:TPA: hypothetical protein I8V91_000828 [Corynebacterium striatum]|uniref:Uncharacterized protein n=1 Tax=Corynebacterium accolens TaxID=38284 RepID=A0A2A4AKG5_9CORY|nr:MULTISPECIES: hypothetical protein [Corynebacterium]PCC83413.1 hypothetical protein COM45_03415 [Corynebacterium accolens]HAT1153525.1 hypothetical protein [Corynebacterium striatum]AMO91145.1 hypothetical protein AWU68_0853 [Corynebacterium simulans]OFQ47086.1 hypothetical protein HMPREF2935_02740 [Corynebacterium sp. HMSC076D02]TXS62641.1 hypothetical protein CHU71_09895 [Corynebacterium sp. LK14]
MQSQTTQMPALMPERIAQERSQIQSNKKAMARVAKLEREALPEARKQERDLDTVFLGILSGVLLVYMALMAAALV